MTTDDIREAMARAMALAVMPVGAALGDVPSSTELARARTQLDAALAALPVSAATLADLAAGRAVVVPVEARQLLQEFYDFALSGRGFAYPLYSLQRLERVLAARPGEAGDDR
jgi:hypothetical protein